MAALNNCLAWLLVATFLAQASGSSSTDLARARVCILGGGIVDMYSSTERCLARASDCPSGSEEAYRMCVAPEAPGLAREVALTIHVPCESCRGDQGMEISGKIWLGLTRLLRVPLQETTAGVLLMDSQLRSGTPLEYFTVLKHGEAPLASGQPTIGPHHASWDLFVAFRLHSARVADAFPGLIALRARDSGPLEQMVGMRGLYVFDYGEKTAAWVLPPSNLHASFKVRGHDWNQRPASSGPTPSPPTPAPALPTPRPTPAPTPAPRPPAYSQRCPCSAYFLGNGYCEQICNIEACDYDGGDCAAPTPSPAPSPVTTTTLATTTQMSCACHEVYTQRRRCNTYCNFVACGFLQASPGECTAEGDSNIWPWELQRPTTTTPAPTPPPTRPPAGSQYSWLNAPRVQPAPTPTAAPQLRGSDAPPTPSPASDAYSLHVAPDNDGSPDSWRVVASNEPNGDPTWFADSPRDEADGAGGLPLWLIIIIVALALIALAFVCALARKSPKPEKPKRSFLNEPEPAYWCRTRPSVDEATPKMRDGSKASNASTTFSWWSSYDPSEGSQDSWDGNDIFGRSPSSKHSKVHPEPEPEDGLRNSKGEWRTPGIKRQKPPKRKSEQRATWQANTGGWAGSPNGRSPSSERRHSQADSDFAAAAASAAAATAAAAKFAAAGRARQPAEPEPEQESRPFQRTRSEPPLRKASMGESRGPQVPPEAFQKPPQPSKPPEVKRRNSDPTVGRGAAQQPKPRPSNFSDPPPSPSGGGGFFSRLFGGGKQEPEAKPAKPTKPAKPAKPAKPTKPAQPQASQPPPPPKPPPKEQPKAQASPPRPQPQPQPKAKAQAKPTGPGPSAGPSPNSGASRGQNDQKRSAWAWGASWQPSQKPEKSPQPSNQPPKEKDPEKHAESMVSQVLKELEQTKLEPLESRKRVFKEWQRKLHPDKNLNCPEAAKLAFQQLMESRAWYLLP